MCTNSNISVWRTVRRGHTTTTPVTFLTNKPNQLSVAERVHNTLYTARTVRRFSRGFILIGIGCCITLHTHTYTYIAIS